VSYRDPESTPGRGQRTLHVAADMDLTKMFVRAVREGGGTGGGGGSGPDSGLRAVEAHIRANYDVEVESGVDFVDILRKASRRALAKNLVVATADGRGFRPTSTGSAKKQDGTKQVRRINLIKFYACNRLNYKSKFSIDLHT